MNFIHEMIITRIDLQVFLVSYTLFIQFPFSFRYKKHLLDDTNRVDKYNLHKYDMLKFKKSHSNNATNCKTNVVRTTLYKRTIRFTTFTTRTWHVLII